MAEIKSFNEALEAARRLFSSATRETEARELAAQLRAAGKLGLGVLRNYIQQTASLSEERVKVVAAMVQGMSEDGLDMIPLLPIFLPLISSPEPQLRNTLTEIVCRLGENSAIAENVALGCLRNPDEDIRQCGAKILNAIAPWCGGALKSRLMDMLPLVAGEGQTENLLKAAMSRCRDGAAPERKTVEAFAAVPFPEVNPPKVAGAPVIAIPDLRGKRVFFADDDSQIRNLMGRLLVNAGAALQLACDGEEAIRMIDDMVNDMQPPHLAILDLRMPGENGMRVLQHLRQYFSPAETPVILLTAVKDAQIIVTAMQKFNISSYLIKPVPITEFYARITQALTVDAEPDRGQGVIFAQK